MVNRGFQGLGRGQLAGVLPRGGASELSTWLLALPAPPCVAPGMSLPSSGLGLAFCKVGGLEGTGKGLLLWAFQGTKGLVGMASGKMAKRLWLEGGPEGLEPCLATVVPDPCIQLPDGAC